MISGENLKRAGSRRYLGISLALALAACGVASLFCARSALAGKMIFLAGHVDQVFQLEAWFSPQSGILTLDPSGTSADEIHVEILAPSSGRSPASVDSAQTILKRLTISRPTSIDLAALSKSAPHTQVIRIRVLAP